MVELSEVMTITEAAQQLGVTRQAIHDAIQREELTVMPIAGRRLLLRREVAEYKPRNYRDRKRGEKQG